MRREETKCKKPLAGTQLLAIVQPNPSEPSLPSGSALLPLIWYQAVGSAVERWHNQHQLDSPQAGSEAQQCCASESDNL